jgi:hypothetical protein
MINVATFFFCAIKKAALMLTSTEISNVVAVAIYGLSVPRAKKPVFDLCRMDLSSRLYHTFTWSALIFFLLLSANIFLFLLCASCVSFTLFFVSYLLVYTFLTFAF